MNLNLSLGTYVLAGVCCVLCNKASNSLKVLHRWHGFCSYSDFISHKYTENTGPDTKIHHLICAHSGYLYYKNCWYKNFCWYKNLFYGGPVPAFQKFLTTYLLLIRSNKTKSFLWNTKNTDRNGINEQNTHHTQRKEL